MFIGQDGGLLEKTANASAARNFCIKAAMSGKAMADSWQNLATRLIVGGMIRMNGKALVGGLSVYLAMGLSTPSVQASPRALSYQTLLAIDDPAKPSAKVQANDAKAAVTETSELGLDGETPAALKPGGLDTAPAAPDEKVAEAAKKKFDDEESSVFTTWWFWALAAGVVGSTVALGVWAAQPSDVPARACPAGVTACFGDGRN
jgi:hypothetical protein